MFCLLRFYFSASNLQSFLVECVENFLLIAAAHQSDSSWDFLFSFFFFWWWGFDFMKVLLLRCGALRRVVFCCSVLCFCFQFAIFSS